MQLMHHMHRLHFRGSNSTSAGLTHRSSHTWNFCSTAPEKSKPAPGGRSRPKIAPLAVPENWVCETQFLAHSLIPS